MNVFRCSLLSLSLSLSSFLCVVLCVVHSPQILFVFRAAVMSVYLSLLCACATAAAAHVYVFNRMNLNRIVVCRIWKKYATVVATAATEPTAMQAGSSLSFQCHRDVHVFVTGCFPLFRHSSHHHRHQHHHHHFPSLRFVRSFSLLRFIVVIVLLFTKNIYK